MQESYRQIIQNKKKNRPGYNKTTIKSSEMQKKSRPEQEKAAIKSSEIQGKVDQNKRKPQASYQNHKEK